MTAYSAAMDIESLTKQLRAQIDGAAAREPLDLVNLYAAHNLVPSQPGTYSIHEVGNHLFESIKVHANSRARHEMNLMKQQLIYEHVLEGVSPHPYVDVLDYARDALRGASERAETNWSKVVEFAHAALTARRHSLTPEEHFRAFHQRHYNIAEAAARFRSSGFKVRLEQGLLTLVDMEAAVADLNNLISSYGGLELTCDIFAYLGDGYDPFLRRYPLHRITSQLPKERAPQVPYPYILHLAARQLANKTDPSGTPLETLTRIIEMTRDLTTLLDAEPYSIFERIFPGEILPFVQKEIIYDSIFVFEQFNPNHLLDLVEQVFTPFDLEDCQEAWGASHAQAVALIRFFLLGSGAYTGPKIYETASLPKRTGLPENAAKSLLRLFVHPGTPNEKYLLPADIQNLDLPFYPLQWVDEHRVLLGDPSWCALRFYEALAAGLRSAKIDKADEKIGKDGAERLLKMVLERAGLAVHRGTGRYGTKGKEEIECDCVVETPTDIIIIELKKKSLTRAARSGQNLNIVLDLCHSLLEAHNQCVTRELVLREFGSFDLNGQVIELGKKRVLRIALTLTEFGSLHDRDILLHFLEMTSNYQVSASDGHSDKKLEAFRNAQQKHRAQLAMLNQYYDDQDRQRPFFYSYFMSMGHIMALLEDVGSPTEFSDRLKSLRHVSTSSGDTYIELSERRRLKSPTTYGTEARKFERELQRTQSAFTVTPAAPRRSQRKRRKP
jgi:hypothetical protein